jgi:hypothetical protein
MHLFVGLGNNWLQRAQHTLARIHHEEGYDTSNGSTDQAGESLNILRSGEDSECIIGSAHPDPRRQGPLYVEARGYLQPAVDFFARAVRSADAAGATSGDLLAIVSLERKRKYDGIDQTIGG